MYSVIQITKFVNFYLYNHTLFLKTRVCFKKIYKSIRGPIPIFTLKNHSSVTNVTIP